MMFAVAAQAQVTGSASTEATIVAPITILNTVDLNFGNLAVSAVGGVVTLSPSDPAIRNQVGGVTFPVVIGTVTAAEFAVTGEPDGTYDITVPSTVVVITNTTGVGGETMDVDNFTSASDPPGAGVGEGLLDPSGVGVLFVGADVTVAAAQAAGVYQSAADFDVTINYN